MDILAVLFFPLRFLAYLAVLLDAIFVTFLITLLSPLKFISSDCYLFMIDTLNNQFYRFFIYFYHLLVGVKIRINSPTVLHQSLDSKWPVFVTNHRTQLDWMLIQLIVGFHRGIAIKRFNVVSRHGLALALPGIGSLFRMTRTILVGRGKEEDAKSIRDVLLWHKTHESETWFGICPEGVIMHSQSYDACVKFCSERNLQVPQNTLIPRTFGFKVLLETMEELGMLDQVFDFTILPLECTDRRPRISMEHLLKHGSFPKHLLVDVRRVDARTDILNYTAEKGGDSKLTGVEGWLENCFKRKESLITKWIDTGCLYPKLSTSSPGTLVKLSAFVCLHLSLMLLLGYLTNPIGFLSLVGVVALLDKLNIYNYLEM